MKRRAVKTEQRVMEHFLPEDTMPSSSGKRSYLSAVG